MLEGHAMVSRDGAFLKVRPEEPHERQGLPLWPPMHMKVVEIVRCLFSWSRGEWRKAAFAGFFLGGSSLHFGRKLLPLSFLMRHLKINLLSDDVDNAFLMWPHQFVGFLPWSDYWVVWPLRLVQKPVDQWRFGISQAKFWSMSLTTASGS
jgi:hypothetical protein